MIKVGMVSLAAPKNLVDSEVMLGTLRAGGYALTPESRRSRRHRGQHLYLHRPRSPGVRRDHPEMAEHKKAGRCRKLVVAGCMVQQSHDELRRAIRRSTPSSPQRHRNGSPRRACSKRDRASRRAARRHGTFTRIRPPHPLDTRVLGLREDFRGVRSHLLVLRHPLVSAACSAQAAHRLGRRGGAPPAAQGVVEINLIAQDTTDYVRISATDPPPRGCSRPSIAWRESAGSASSTPTRTGSRPSSSRRSPRAAGSRAISISLCSTPTPACSRRCAGGQRRHASEAADRAPEPVPGISLRTTLIVGFPGETEDAFAALCRFVEQAELDHLGVFTYSEEKGTAPPRSPTTSFGAEGGAPRAPDGHPGGDRGAQEPGPPRAHDRGAGPGSARGKRPDPVRPHGRAGPDIDGCVLITGRPGPAESRRLRAGPHSPRRTPRPGG